MIKTVYEDGYSWISIPDELWVTKEVTEVWMGIPIYAPMFSVR